MRKQHTVVIISVRLLESHTLSHRQLFPKTSTANVTTTTALLLLIDCGNRCRREREALWQQQQRQAARRTAAVPVRLDGLEDCLTVIIVVTITIIILS